ncbi:protein kinase domain-containing protein [Sphingomonas sp. LaA6.9]|uniref:protein kinase domain-containing protein n=1 Tax=Sphingomonas sp. LaA6.9 TaxID=2919914 RepID=UPI001F5021F4|nr:protein kinase [Sphingomonas sp. LaA6.9]MCJ8158899.1 protein kinase [Sphingomonas sp. LaA6.9]
MTAIGRYRIDGEIGEGAMANVHLGHDPSIDRSVAIKVLKPEFRADPEVVRRFLGESRAAGKLSHANIVTIYDVGEADGAPYIAMEHLFGRPLDTVLREAGQLGLDKVLTLGVQLADALSYAHERGVIHRDVKPSNILACDGDTRAKLLDFGIARMDTRDVALGEIEAERTQAGQIMGTPRYMSPEQVIGLPIDARTDQFSLGAVLYEMVTGRPAFPGTGLATLAIQIAQHDPMPIETHRPDCPSGLRFLIEKMLSKKPDDRFSNCHQARDALYREIDAAARQREAPRHGMPLHVRLPLIFAGAAAVALSLGSALVLERQRETLMQMALTSGSSMTAFIARNAALRMADNAALPADQQDWLPLQAFVESAAKDPNVRSLTIIDENGRITASGSPALVGTSVRGIRRGRLDDVLHFSEAVRYGGAGFGRVDMELDRSGIDTAMRDAALLLVTLSLFVVLVIAAIGYMSARQLSSPLSALRRALDDMAEGNTTFRLSHRRKDELGRLFDAFNRLATAVQQGAITRESAVPPEQLLMTRIDRAPAHDCQAA